MGIDAAEQGKRGQFACLVALSSNGETCKGDGAAAVPGTSVPAFFKFLLAEPLRVRSASP